MRVGSHVNETLEDALPLCCTYLHIRTKVGISNLLAES